MKNVLMMVNLEFLRLWSRGKVRDIFDLGEYLLVVVTDRMSAFDVIMNQGIPGKGRALNGISTFWFKAIAKRLPWVHTHFVTGDWAEIVAIEPQLAPYEEMLEGRSMVVKKADMVFPIEAIIRGLLYGSVEKEYKEYQTVGGISMPSGLLRASKLPEPILTPSTKAAEGQHDENISEAEMMRRGLLDETQRVVIKKTSLSVYEMAYDMLEPFGIILCDTKFEFGLINGIIHLIDEALTPDSSRLLVAGFYPGDTPTSYDKQFLRDFLEGLVKAGKWDKKAPAPDLPEEIMAQTADRYQSAYRVITGRLAA